MAKIIKVEQSGYINKAIDIYAANKVGQYSKFLDKNQVFVTYFPINQVMSRADTGLGGVSEELGSGSSLRYNKIKNFPVYNIQELRPDIDYDEMGADLSLEMSGVIVLPGTIKPMAGDYLLITLPQSREALFRVTNFSFNTIQSNDFYTIDIELKRVGKDVEADAFKGILVDSFETIFENIGTEDKCFIRTDDVTAINTIADFYETLKDFYYKSYFNDNLGGFVYENLFEDSNAIYYDMYLEEFIKRTGIYEGDYTIYLSGLDVKKPDFDTMYMQTLLYAVETNNLDYLQKYIILTYGLIQRALSPFKIYNLNGRSSELLKVSGPINETETMYSYYNSNLIQDILKVYHDELGENEELPIQPNIIFELIYKYLLRQSIKIEKKDIIPYMIDKSLFGYKYLPIIMHIIAQYYKSYFIKLER